MPRLPRILMQGGQRLMMFVVVGARLKCVCLCACVHARMHSSIQGACLRALMQPRAQTCMHLIHTHTHTH
jgi:hypothetical protein